jgi:hypothetical protein
MTDTQPTSMEDSARPGHDRSSVDWARGFEQWCAGLMTPSHLEGRTLWKFIGGIGVAAGLASVFLRGFHPTLYNGVAHIPYLKHRLDPELYPGDLLIAAHENYYSLLWELVVGLSSVLPLFGAMFVFYVIQQVLFHTALTALAYRLGRSILFTIVCNVFFMLWINPGLGGSCWSSLSAAHSSFSFPFFIFAVVALLDRRVVLAALMWAVGAQFHLPNATYCAPMMGILGVWALATDPRGIARSAIGGVIAAVVAAAGLYWAASQVMTEDSQHLALTMEELRLLTRNRVGPHIFLEANYTGTTAKNWFKAFLAQGVSFLVIAAASWRVVPILRPLLLGMIGLLGVLALGIVATDVLESVSIARMMLLRVGDFIGFFFLFVPLALGGMWLSGRLPLFVHGLPFFLAFTFAGTEGWEGDHTLFRAALVVVVVSLLVSWMSRSARGAELLQSSTRWFPTWLRSMPLPVRAVFLFAIIALPGMVLAVFVEHRANLERQHEADGRNEARDWIRVQEWAQENTPKDTVFLTPPLRSGWRTHSERGSFIELRDGNPIVLNNNIHAEFRRRADLVNMHLEDHQHTEKIPEHLFLEVDEQRLRAIGESEGIKYAVLEVWHDSGSLPVVFENRHFKVVLLGDE